MKLYISNCTKQDHDFTYRMPETGKITCQRIRAGDQIQVFRDATMDDIEYILQQHRVYGLVDAKDIKRMSGFVGLCYSIDRPVDPENIMIADEQNNAAIIDRSVEIHQTNAAAITDAMQQHSGGNLNSYSLELTEQLREGGETKEGQSATLELDTGKRRGRPRKD